jgi:hypothetical protein
MNPFSGFGKVIPHDRLRGRENEMEELVRALTGFDQNVSLVGQPRVGKSSLALAAVDLLSEQDKAVTIAITLSSCASPTEFFRELLDAAAEGCIGKRLPLPVAFDRARQMPAHDGYEAYVRCKRGLQQLHRDGIRVLIVVDEFDAVLNFDERRETILRFREIIYQQHLYGASALIVSRRSIPIIEGQIDGVSTLAGVVSHVMFLRPLNRGGFDAVVERCLSDWSVPTDERDRLWSITGGHPFMTEMLLYYAWPQQSIEEGYSKGVFQILQYYSQLRELHIADNLFGALIQVSVGPRWSVTPAEIQQLLSYGLIAPDTCRAFSEHYQEYLMRCAREGATMNLWRETEVALRDFVEGVSIKSLGVAWERKIASIPGKEQIKKILESARQLQQKDTRSFGNCSPRLLDYLYPMELWDIIVAQWNVFAPMLPVSGLQGNAQKGYWRERFELFSKVRNPQMYHREQVIPASELTTASGYCQELLSTVRASQK